MSTVSRELSSAEIPSDAEELEDNLGLRLGGPFLGARPAGGDGCARADEDAAAVDDELMSTS